MAIVTSSGARRGGRRRLTIAALIVLAAAILAIAIIRLRPESGSEDSPLPSVALDAAPPSAREAGVATMPPSSRSAPRPSHGSPPASSFAAHSAQSLPAEGPVPGGALSDRPDAYHDLPGRLTLPDGNVLTFPPPPPDKPLSISAQGRVYLADSVGNFVDATPKPVFDDPIEEQMVGISTPGGRFVPGLFLSFPTAAITNMLNREVVIYDDDDEAVKAKKEAVAETKQLMLSYLEAGYSLAEVVMSISDLAEQERAIRTKGIAAIMRMVREGDIEGARKYKETLDEVVAEQQLSPIVLPKRVAEALYGE